METENAKYRNEPYMYIIDRMGELGKSGISPEMETRYCSMLIEISEKYHAIPYHNISHGFDVMRVQFYHKQNTGSRQVSL